MEINGQTVGIMFIITNEPKTKHYDIYQKLCCNCIQTIRERLSRSIPIAIMATADELDLIQEKFPDVQIINIASRLEHYKNDFPHRKKVWYNLVYAEILKTMMCDISPFDRTLYLDADTFICTSRNQAYDYLTILDKYNLSICTCVTESWKDSCGKRSVGVNLFPDVPAYFPYWNFGVFGSHKERSRELLESILEQYLTYAFAEHRSVWKSGCEATPHAQPAVAKAVWDLSPNDRVFTMPAEYNCIFSWEGYCFNSRPAIAHVAKSVREHFLME